MRTFLFTRPSIDFPPIPITILTIHSIQVNLAAETGEMGILAQHVPSIEQLKPGLVEVIEESGSKQFFREWRSRDEQVEQSDSDT